MKEQCSAERVNSETIDQCYFGQGHGGHHVASDGTTWNDNMCGAKEPGYERYCSRPEGHTESHREYENHVVGVGEPLAVWPQEKTGPVRCTQAGNGMQCELDAGHKSEHRADDGVQVTASWPRSTGVPADVVMATLEFCGKDPSPGHGYPPCGLVLGHDRGCVSGSDDTAGFLVQLSERITELEERHARVQLGEAGERKVLSDRIDRLKDDTRDAAAAAGEALERTKGLQVSEILRRLNQTERRINSMDGGRVAGVTDPDDRLLTAVRDLTTVMRELVRQNTPPELCGDPAPMTRDRCSKEKGHDGRHGFGISSWPRDSAEPTVCTATLVTGVDEVQSLFPCLRPAGHPGMHRDKGNDRWMITGI